MKVTEIFWFCLPLYYDKAFQWYLKRFDGKKKNMNIVVEFRLSRNVSVSQLRCHGKIPS